MAISTEKRKAGPYRSDGEIVEYEFDFYVMKAEDIRVVYADTDGVEYDLDPSAFYVEFNEDQAAVPGGKVIFYEPLPKNYVIAILSVVDYLQQTVLTNRGGFFPEVINAALDKATMQIQQLREIIDRCLKVGAASTRSPEEVIDDINKQFDNNLALLNQIYAAMDRAELAAQKLESPQFGAYKLKKQAVQSSVLIDPLSAGVHVLTLTKPNCSLSIAGYQEIPNTARMITLFIVQGTGVNRLGWPGNVRWSQGREPILSSVEGRIDCVSLLTVDGGDTWLGTFNGGWF